MKKFLILFFVFFALFVEAKDNNISKKEVHKIDPVYGIDVTKYPKFNAKIILSNNKEIIFCCPKAMFDFYFRPTIYPEYGVKEEKDFKKLLVRDYISGDWIDAKKAMFVFGSRLQGPKGDDLIPVKNKDMLNIYILKYGGSKVLTFPEVRKRGMGLIKFLDMP